LIKHISVGGAVWVQKQKKKKHGLVSQKLHFTPCKLVTVRCSGQKVIEIAKTLLAISIIFCIIFLLKAKQNIYADSVRRKTGSYQQMSFSYIRFCSMFEVQWIFFELESCCVV
jgi:hypothetical protein